ncbi:hypothetical protein SUGI_0037840 [Cryptomeria japonica]|uniref:probable glucan 1,3-beta-glucosidase A n=1 Tax=Cryptomeria japonica TaxID=3369 RepID=UPI002408D55D|nr:probable glucan 1,3-beta-glucosidase A [Cryptomeria japonica]GLJ06386.1 hypothetical protein SUGI_0037840 [Cryptomeria japonica]
MAALVSSHLDKPVNLLCLSLLLLVCILSQRSCAQTTYKSVNLGGWLVVEGWIKPTLFDSIPDNDLTDGTQIQLKSVTLGTYLVAEDGGGSKIAVNRNSASGWETFKIWRVKDGSYQLRVFNKKFMVAQNGGGGIVNAVTTTPSTWETFQIIRNPSNRNQVHIKVLNGMYMQAKSQDQLTADFQGEPGWGNNAATFEMNTFGQLKGEYQLTNGLGNRAQQVLNDHRNTFITESDFSFLSQHQINAVRIPVGWWIASDPNPPAPFVGGSLKALDDAFSWAKKHNIKIIVDLHAAPGSQNGDEHSGTRDGYIEWDSQNNIDKSISVIDFLASRYAKDSALLGIELLNEPRTAIQLDTLTPYYKKGYDTIRKYSSSAYVMMCNRIGGADPKELFQMNNGLTRTVVDVHYYNLFDDQKFKSMTVQQNIDFVKYDRAALLNILLSANGPLIYVGEWTSEWEVKGASQSEYQRFGQAQLEVYGKASFGWAYWTHKNVQEHWSFQWMVQNQYLDL